MTLPGVRIASHRPTRTPTPVADGLILPEAAHIGFHTPGVVTYLDGVPVGWCNIGPLLQGAVEYAGAHGAPAVEAYPVDPPGRMDTTMAFVGTRSMFQKAGFRVIGKTDAVASRMPRLIMRRDLA